MTIETQTPRVVIIGNGTRGPYTLVDSSGQAIRLVSTSHLRLTRYAASTTDNDAGTLLVENTDYTVGGTQDARTFTLASGQAVLTSSQRILAERVQTYTQELDLTTGGAFNAVAVEARLDKITEVQQELKAQLARKISLQFADATADVALPSPPSARKFLTRESDGSISQTDEPVLAAVSAGYLTGNEKYATGDGTTTVFTFTGMGASQPSHIDITIDGIGGQRWDEYEVGLSGTTTTVIFDTAPPNGAGIVFRPRVFPGLTGPAGTPADMDGYDTLSGGDGTETHWVRTSGSLNRKVTTNNTPVKATGATTAQTLADRFGDEKSIMDFGAVGDGTTHPLSERYASLAAAQAVYSFVTALTQEIDWAALQAGVNWAGTNTGLLRLPARSFYINDEVTFEDCTTHFGIKGAGPRHSRILVASGVGQTKWVLKGINPDTDTRTLENLLLEDFEIAKYNTVSSKTDPGGIFLPYDTNSQINRVRVRALGNTALWISSANNTRVKDFWAVGGGWHITNQETKSTSYYYSIDIGASATTLNADSGTPFDASDVGKVLYIPGAAGGGAALAVTVTSQTGTSCEFTPAALASVTSIRISWEGALGAIASSSTTLTTDTAMFDAADVGRWVYVLGAGPAGGVLVTTIASRTSSTEVELALAASTTVTAADVLFTPMIFCGDITADDGEDRGLNDIVFDNPYVEQNQCADYFIRRGTNVKLKNAKSHGMGTGSITRVGRNRRNFICDSVRNLVIDGGEWDYGYNKTGGNVLICGGQTHVIVDNVTAGVLTANQYVFDFCSTDADSILEIKGGHLWKENPELDPGFIRFGGSVTWANVRGLGPATRAIGDNRLYNLPANFRSINIDSTEDAATVDGILRRGGRPTGATNDAKRDRWYMSDAAGTEVEVARTTVQITAATAGAVSSRYIWSVISAGTIASELALSANSLSPFANGGLALGGTSVPWNGVYANTTGYFIGSTKVVGTQEAAVADASGGATVDTEARAAINALLARLRTHGLIAT